MKRKRWKWRRVWF